MISTDIAFGDLDNVDYGMLCARTGASDERPSVRFRAVSLDPVPPARTFCALVDGARGSFTSAIAMRRSADVMLETLLNSQRNADSRTLMEQALKRANEEVFGYSARMNVQGQLWARTLAAVFDGERVTIARVGNYQSYLGRGGELTPVFEIDPTAAALSIGSEHKVLVDFASMQVESGDLLLLTLAEPRPEFQAIFAETLRTSTRMQDAAMRLADVAAENQALTGVLRTNSSVVLMRFE